MGEMRKPGMNNTGGRVSNAGSRTSNTGERVSNSGSRTSNTGERVSNPGSRTSNTGNRIIKNDLRSKIGESRETFEKEKRKYGEVEARKREDRRHRGLDIIPQDDKETCGKTMAGKKKTSMIVSAVLVAICVVFLIVCLIKGSKLYILAIVFGLLFVVSIIKDFMVYRRFASGKFELYGGNIMEIETIREKNPSAIDSRGNFKEGVAEKDKYVERTYAKVNGVYIKITDAQKSTLSSRMDETYYYVLRFKHMNVENDEYYFMKADRSVEDSRTGDYYPGEKWKR